MFEKPKVNLIEDQQIQTNQDVNIDSWEAEQLLRKYGFYNQPSSYIEEPIPAVKNLTFEEMIAQDREKREREEQERMRKLYGPKPITFGGDRYESEVRYESDEDSGFGFKIEITTDMKLPKY